MYSRQSIISVVTKPFKAGFVALLGRPNAGKSTLMNALIGQKVSIVSSKPQTTRHRIIGIRNAEDHQICFMDTPGLLRQPQDLLQQALRHAAVSAARDDADLVLLLVEPEMPKPDDLSELKGLPGRGIPVFLVLNKADLPAALGLHEAVLRVYTAAVQPVGSFKVSALKGQGVPELLEAILQRLPESPAFYDPGQLSDRYERFFAAELIREQVFQQYTEEIPHSTAVVVETYREQEGFDEVFATLFVERDGQKGIILGTKGNTLKSVTAKAQAAISDFVGRRVELEIWVKVRHNWRKDPKALREFGY